MRRSSWASPEDGSGRKRDELMGKSSQKPPGARARVPPQPALHTLPLSPELPLLSTRPLLLLCLLNLLRPSSMALSFLFFSFLRLA